MVWMRLVVVAMVLASGVMSGVGSAQGTGTIHGVVKDPTGAAIVGVQVSATLTDRGLTRTASSGADGAYVLPLLPVGTYSLVVEHQGFKQFRRADVTLTANENVRIDAALELGSVSEEVTVTGEASLVDARSSAVGTLIDSRRVVELPINGRNVVGLAELLPGVAAVSAPQTFTDDRGGPTVSISGARANQNLYLLDGANLNSHFRNTGLNYPPPDALQEVKVLTHSFSAEYGRNAGAIFNVVTKSGTNEVHGSVWEFLRNDKLNARNFFAPSAKPKLIQNQFGVAGGGPIVKNKLFLFSSYEGLRIRPGSLQTSAFPLTAAERAGDFSANPKTIVDPVTGQPFPGNRIPMERIDTVAGNVLSQGLMPLPSSPDGQLVEVFPLPENSNQFLTRLDYHFGKHTIDGRYNYNKATSRSVAGQVPSYTPVAAQSTNQNITIGETAILSANVINQFRASFNRVFLFSVTEKEIHLSDLGANFPVFGPRLPPHLVLSGRVTLGSTAPISPVGVNESLQFGDTVHWTKGEHSLKLGFEYMKSRYLFRTVNQTMGSFTFSGQLSGDPASDFLLGRPASMGVSGFPREAGGIQTSTYYFLQDDWRVHPHLTLNLGLRYELALPWVHENDFWGTLIPGRQSVLIPNAPVGLLYPGDPDVPRGLIQTDKNNWAPRFGFAWSPLGSSRTSVRGAYGVFYEVTTADIIQNDGQPNAYTFTFQVPHSLTDPLRGQPFIPTAPDYSNPVFVGRPQISYPSPLTLTPYVQHFNLNIQREMAPNLAVQVGYVGRLFRKLRMSLPANAAVYAPGATLGNINQRRLLPAFGNNRRQDTVGNGAYSGLQVELTKRFSNGFSIQGAYALARSIDMSSGITASLNAAPPNIFDLRAEWGLADFHSKHIGSFSWIWDLPRFESSQSVVRGILGGWQLNGFLSARSGTPFNLLTGSDVALSGTQLQRPDVIGDHRLPDGRPRGEQVLAWFDRRAFALPQTGTYGNVGRNALIGPGSAVANLGLFKNFSLPGREGLRLQFRSEFFNVLNNVNLSNPNSAVTAGANMGRITSAGEARVIQFALKVLF